MRIFLILAWLFVGLGAGIYHFGPGQKRLQLDQIASMISEARQMVESERWEEAVEQFDAILSALPGEHRLESMQFQLEKAKAQMMAAQLPMARRGLEQLLVDLQNEPQASPELIADAQSALANSQYYMAWLMRLEGLPEDEWMAEIESCRQHYTQLMKDAGKMGDAMLAQRASEDMESAIRLARMDLGELQGLPLPNQ
jgi:hypothetical protein